MRRAAMPALALIIVGNFAGYAVAGPNGLLAWGGYHRDLEQRKVELAKLDVQKAALRHRSNLLDPRRPIPTWPTNWSAATLAWCGPTKWSSRSIKSTD